MCVVNKLFELFEFFYIPFMLTCSMIIFFSLLLLGRCACVVSIVMWSSLVCLSGCLGTLCRCGGCSCCVMRLLLFVLHLSMPREYEDARVRLVWGMDEVWLR